MIWRWWMTLLVILAVLALIGCIPVGGDVRYDENGLVVKAKAAFLRIQLIPKQEKPAKKKKKKPGKPKPPKEEKPKEDKKQSSIKISSLDDVLELLDLLGDTLGNLRRKLRLEELTLHVTFDGSDPAAAALNYGRAWAFIGALTPALERIFVIKKRDICPILDYNESGMKLDAHLILTITVGRILSLALRAGVRGLKVLKQIKKGGAEHKSSSV